MRGGELRGRGEDRTLISWVQARYLPVGRHAHCLQREYVESNHVRGVLEAPSQPLRYSRTAPRTGIEPVSLGRQPSCDSQSHHEAWSPRRESNPRTLLRSELPGHQDEEMGCMAGVEPSFSGVTSRSRYRTSTHTIVRIVGVEPTLLASKARVLPQTLDPDASSECLESNQIYLFPKEACSP